MKVGDVLIAINGAVLACGAGRYSHAICVSVEPFVMVSEHGDMLWSQFDINDVRPLCQASEEIVRVAMGRYRRHQIGIRFELFTDALRYVDKNESNLTITELNPENNLVFMEMVKKMPLFYLCDLAKLADVTHNAKPSIYESFEPASFADLQRGFAGKIGGVDVWVVMDDEQEIGRFLAIEAKEQ